MTDVPETMLEAIAGMPARPLTEAEQLRLFRIERNLQRAIARKKRGYSSRSQERFAEPPWQHIGRVRRVDRRPGSPWRGHKTTMRNCHRLRVAAVAQALTDKRARDAQRGVAH